jgi:hypothetical protein
MTDLVETAQKDNNHTRLFGIAVRGDLSHRLSLDIPLPCHTQLGGIFLYPICISEIRMIFDIEIQPLYLAVC